MDTGLARFNNKHLVRHVRQDSGLTMQQAANLVHTSVVQWARYEAVPNAIPLAVWELFLIKLHTPYRVDFDAIRSKFDI